MNKKYPMSRKDNIVVQELDGEVLIYDLKIDKAFCLNETSALVWELCDGNKSIAEISQSVGKKLNSPANEDLVWLAIDQLKKEKLIINGEELFIPFDGLSRREVIKKIGLTSMVALPLVASIVAPSAANAASAAACPAPGAFSITENNPCAASCQCRGQVGAGPGGFIASNCCHTSTNATNFCKQSTNSGDSAGNQGTYTCL